MTEKKVHWKTAKKLADEAEALIETAQIEEVVQETPKSTPKSVSRPYRVYDKRSNLVAQVYSEEEANYELSRFPGGRKEMI